MLGGRTNEQWIGHRNPGKLLIILAVFLAIATSPLALAQTSGTDEQLATKKLGVFLGKWQGEGEFFDTPYSKAAKVSSTIDCSWSPQRNFLICEQLITDANGKHTQLSIYSYNAKDGNYNITSMAGPGRQPWNGTVIIKGAIWTYPGGYEADGKKVEIRTVNDFSVPGTESFKTEFSDDGGAHWVVTLQGKAHKAVHSQ